MLTNTELLLIQLNNKMDRLLELLEGRDKWPSECPDIFNPYVNDFARSVPLIKDSSYECGAAGKDDTNERG